MCRLNWSNIKKGTIRTFNEENCLDGEVRYIYWQTF
jgi:hypothetical protein